VCTAYFSSYTIWDNLHMGKKNVFGKLKKFWRDAYLKYVQLKFKLFSPKVASWYGLQSSRNLFLYWRIRLTARTHFYSNADHTRRIRKGRDVTKSDAFAQKTHRMHAVCIQLKRLLVHHLNDLCSNFGVYWNPCEKYPKFTLFENVQCLLLPACLYILCERRTAVHICS